MHLHRILITAALTASVLGITAGTASATGITYANCDAVRAAGKAPLLKGQPGYSADLDRDGDGIACETGSTPTTAKAPTTTKAPTAPTSTIRSTTLTTATPTTMKPVTAATPVKATPSYTG